MSELIHAYGGYRMTSEEVVAMASLGVPALQLAYGRHMAQWIINRAAALAGEEQPALIPMERKVDRKWKELGA